MLSTRKTARYGWRRDLPDARDLIAAVPATGALPSKVDLTPKMPPVYDQGQLGSCTANAIGAAVQYSDLLELQPGEQPSRLFIYYGEREIEHTVDQDAGAAIRDGIKVVAKLGAPAETLWPYDIARFAEKPSQAAYAAARGNLALKYQRVPRRLRALKAVLAAGHPVVIGFTVYSSFESAEVARTGVLNMPGADEQILGGHAVLVVGYDDAEDRWRIRNSWGAGWGQDGYFTMPYQYLMEPGLASDFWTITKTS